MLDCEEFFNILQNKNIEFFTGVPDSLLKDFNAYILDNVSSSKHIITANEGGAIALGVGYHLATEKIPLIYMQNSGQGNTINPLTSLADPEVYSIPMILLIGWRSEPGIKDEPQHIKQGRITLNLLDTLEIPYHILPDNIGTAKKIIEEAVKSASNRNAPYALVVKKGTFDKYELKNKSETSFDLSREDAIKLITSEIHSNDVVISTTGQASRELFEYREALKHGHSKDFLTVGSMGHSSQIALGISLSKPNRQVFCFDGDGSLIMHMGSLAIIGNQTPKNFKHIVFNNGTHDSVGGQPTSAFNISIPDIAKACGYKNAWTAKTLADVKGKIKLLKKTEGPALLEIKVNKGARKDLGRPTTTPIENKKAFMENLKN